MRHSPVSMSPSNSMLVEECTVAAKNAFGVSYCELALFFCRIFI